MPATLAPEYYVSTSYASLSGIMKLGISRERGETERRKEVGGRNRENNWLF